MSLLTDPKAVKLQIESKKNILLLYCILGVGLFIIGIAISSEISPATPLFFGALLIAFIFYYQINKLLIDPTTLTIASLKNIMYIFMAVFIIALAVDVFWQEFLTFTSLLALILAIAGYFIMNQIIINATLFIPGNQSSMNRNPLSQVSFSNKTKFCPSCGTSLESSTESKFCPSCGQKL